MLFIWVASALILNFGVAAFALDPEGQSQNLKTEEPPLSHAVNQGISMRVLWTISGYKVGKDAVWGEEDARKLLSKPLDIDATTITFNGRTCRDVLFKRESVGAKEYLNRAYHITPQAFGIEQDSVEVVKTNCDIPGFGEYVRLKDRRLVISINGVFFYFEPAMNY
jgi:hypothetical protein